MCWTLKERARWWMLSNESVSSLTELPQGIRPYYRGERASSLTAALPLLKFAVSYADERLVRADSATDPTEGKRK